MFAVFVLIGTYHKETGRKLLFREYPDGIYTGDMFKISKIEDFKGKIPVIRGQEKGTLKDADVITFGDSFFNSELGSPKFAKQLEDVTGGKVFSRGNQDDDYFDEVDFNPLAYLKSVNYVKGDKKFMILESVERFALQNALKYEPAPAANVSLLVKVYEGVGWRMREVDTRIKNHVVVLHNDNEDIKYFFSHNTIAYPITKWIANVRFKVFGEVDNRIGAYSLNPVMMFYHEDITLKKKFTDQDLERMAGNIANLAGTLREKYNIELFYMIMPNKYSLYNDFVNGVYGYDNFIPKVNVKLREKGVAVIDLYSAYMDYRKQNQDKEWLYYPSDTHFTPVGKDIAVSLTVQELKRHLNPNEHNVAQAGMRLK